MSDRPRRPRIKVPWWIRKWSRIKRYRTPLQFRGSIRRLRHHHKRPYVAFLRLCMPTASLAWKYPLPEPLSPLALAEDPDLCWNRRCDEDIKNLQCIPVWRSRDTPLRSLYRMYEAFMGGITMFALIQYEVEYFWFQSRQSWELRCIPDPKDPDPIRYAILASIVESMPEAFNFKLSIGMRRDGKHIPPTDWDGVNNPYAPYVPVTMPSWPRHVPPVDKQYLRDIMPARMLDSEGRLILHEDADSEIFMKRNIVATEERFWRI